MDGTLQVKSKGVLTGRKTVDPKVGSRIRSLASRLVTSKPKIIHYQGPHISDDMKTSIEIVDGEKRTTVNVASGDQAPMEVWDLIGTAMEATEGLT